MERFLKHHNVAYRVAFVAEEKGNDLFKRYRASSLPQVVICDRQGKVRLVRVGGGQANAKDIESTIQSLLDNASGAD